MPFIPSRDAQRTAEITANILRSRRKKLQQGLWRGPMFLAQSFSRFDHANYVYRRLVEAGENPLLGFDNQAAQPYTLATPLRADDRVEPNGGLRQLQIFSPREFITEASYRCCDSYVAEVGSDYCD